MIFIVSVSVTSLQLAYSKSAIFENTGIPRPPILGGRDNSLLSTSEHLMPPVIAGIKVYFLDGMNCFVIAKSNTFNRFAMFGIVLIR